MGCAGSVRQAQLVDEPLKACKQEYPSIEQTLLTSSQSAVGCGTPSGQAHSATEHAGEANMEDPRVEEAFEQSSADVNDCDGLKKFESVHIEFIGISGNKGVSSFSANVDTTVDMLRKHVLSQVEGVDVVLSSGATILDNREQKLSEYTWPSEKGSLDLSYVFVSGDPTDAEVTANPGRYKLCLSGHIRDQCNGLYTYDGKENGKPAWKKPGSKVFWTFWGGRGHTWDIYWGGISPENKSDTAIPPRSGWDGQGQGANTISISYVYA